MFRNQFEENHAKSIEAVKAAIDQSQDILKSFIAIATSKVPAGLEAYGSAFTFAFNTAIQNFDRVRSTTQALRLQKATPTNW